MNTLDTSKKPLCVHCQSAHVVKNGHKDGKQRFRCLDCKRTFGPTYGTPLYGLHTRVEEIVRTLLVVMRRGSLCAAEEITGHKYETIGDWLRRAADHADALTQALVTDLHLSEVEVDAFWSFVKKSVQTLQAGNLQIRRPGWAHAGAVWHRTETAVS
jgi:transposase-like protein